MEKLEEDLQLYRSRVFTEEGFTRAQCGGRNTSGWRSKAEQLKSLDLLFVGSPTRAFSPTKAITTFLNSIHKDSLKGISIAAFDTRAGQEEMKSGWLRVFAGMFGYAAKPILDKLERKGGKLLAPPERFYVLGSEGPLKDGELERAAAGAKTLTKK